MYTKHFRSKGVKKETIEKLIDFCAKDLRPFNIIEGDGFKELIQHFIKIDAKYGNIDVNKIIPSRKTISNRVEDKYFLLKNQFIKKFKTLITLA